MKRVKIHIEPEFEIVITSPTSIKVQRQDTKTTIVR